MTKYRRITKNHINSIYLTLIYRNRLQNAKEGDKELLYQKYALTVFDMCSNYEKIYDRLQRDMGLIKEQLLREFKS